MNASDSIPPSKHATSFRSWQGKYGTVILVVVSFALGITFAFGRDAVPADTAPSGNPLAPQPASSQSCEKCGHLIAPREAKSHQCESAPLSKQELQRRKEAAEALSRGQDEEFHLRSSASSSTPKELTEYIRNQSAAVALGKALFWDMRVGSDDRTACATCHHHAGTDTRTKNTATSFIDDDQEALRNQQWTKADHTPWKEGVRDSKGFGLITGDSSVVIGSQGVRAFKLDQKDFAQQVQVGSKQIVEHVLQNGEPTHPFRQVTDRNSPTVINSGTLARLFYDGRAADAFNGYDVFGPDSPYVDDIGKYRVKNGRLERITIRIPQAATASQAMGPPLSHVEMSYKGRNFCHIALKLLGSKPLVGQDVSSNDSILGRYLELEKGQTSVKGLNLTYREMIEAAFHETWWQQRDQELSIHVKIPGDDVQIPGDDVQTLLITDMMVANFSLYFGLAIMAYEQTLVSDEAPFDRFMRGDVLSMTPRARLGFERFVGHGCADCHLMPEFAGSTIQAIFGAAKELEFDEYESELLMLKRLPKPLNPDGNAFVEEMLFKFPQMRFAAYDNGFYNIGVTGLIPNHFDFGAGREFRLAENSPQSSIDANFNPFGHKMLTQKAEQLQLPISHKITELGKPFQVSRARQIFPDQAFDKDRQSAMKGAFKTPSLRNVTLTAPYMHNGAFLTLKEVMRFYRYGPRNITGDTEAKYFHHPELELLRASLDGDPNDEDDGEPRDDEILAFLGSLTDIRVARHAAPFDHPSLILPSGNKANAVGKGNELDETFELPAIGGEPTPEQLKALQSLPSWSKLGN